MRFKKMKKSFTLIEILVALAIGCILFVLVLGGGSSEGGFSINKDGSFNMNQQIDGHLFIKNSDGGMVHHPDCSCGK